MEDYLVNEVSSGETVLLCHSCQDCKYTTREVTRKTTSDYSVHYHFLRELDGKKEFGRFPFEDLWLISCPKCGAASNCSFHEKEIPYQEQ